MKVTDWFWLMGIGLLERPMLARNLWTQQDSTEFKEQLTQRVQPHETILLKITP